jgi:putative ABC transport system permease protein
MLKNYLLAALRGLKRQKVFTAINIAGLALGMAGFTLFALMSGAKLNADRFHEHADRIYCLVQVRTDETGKEEHTTFIPGPLAPALKSDYPEIQDFTRVLSPGRVILKRGEDGFYESNVLFVDPNFLSVFSFQLVQGDPETALSSPDSIIITQRAATKYFGDEDPIGKLLTMEPAGELKVTGVARDIPRTSSLHFNFLVPLKALSSVSAEVEDWKTSRHTAFLLAGPGFDHRVLEEKLPAFLSRHYPDAPESSRRLYVLLFRKFRLNSRQITSLLSSSHPASVYATLALGVVLLLVVSINFINLSIARYMHRAREIGMRKVIGASRRQILFQFMGEALLLSILALPAAIILYELIHPAMYAVLGDLSAVAFTSGLSNSIWNYPFLLKYLVIAAILTGLFSGIYPAIFLSSLEPIRVLAGKSTAGRRKKRGSKILIIFQFTLAVVFIAASSLIKEQSGHLLRADLGFSREQIAVIRLNQETRAKLELLKEKAAVQASVLQVTASSALPLVWENPRPARPPDAAEEEAITFQAYGVDYNFTEALEIPLIRGRAFSRTQPDREALILNETAVKKLGWENPIGRPLVVGDRTGIVIGVAKDFLFADIGFRIPPAALYLAPDALEVLLVKYAFSANYPDLRNDLKEQWQSLYPDLPFECEPLADTFNRTFGLLEKMANFLNIIGLTIVVFACLGLLGLAPCMVEQRTKEIGIRRVLGASSPRILWSLMRGYIFPVMAANVAALGLISFGWHKVLQTGLLFFTGIGPGTYAYALLFSLASAAAAVTSQTWRAVRANPADSLRNE